jgi:hypothetical protein
MYGRLTEAVHFAGYSADRALQQLESLIENGHWRLIGGHRFDNINSFLESVKLDENFRLASDERKRFVTRIKDLQPDASNRQIARTFRVNHKTVDRDLGPKAPTHSEKTNENKGPILEGGANAPPASTSGLAGSVERAISTQSNVTAESIDQRGRSAVTPRTASTPDPKEGPPVQKNLNHLISQFATEVRTKGIEVARQLDVSHRSTLIKRLHEIADEIVQEIERGARPTQTRQDEGIPSDLRRA